VVNKRGFGGMTDEQKSKISSKGGKTSHANGTAHVFDSEEARVAGRKGGKSVSKDREHMAEIGRRGGKSRGKQKTKEKEESE
jgi:general stress protein YciG